MKTYLDCVACLVRQSVDAVKVAASDEGLQKETLQAVMEEVSRLDYSDPPPVMGARIHRVIREVTGNPDPYLELKDRCNRLALERLPALRERVGGAVDPFEAAVRLAIAGNVMDFAVLDAGYDIPIDEAVEAALAEPLGIDDVEGARTALADAGSILYLADNAGEIVFDRLLLERLPAGRVVVAVKGGPVINDATLADARDAGLTAEWEVITTGSRYPGAVLEKCSAEFLKHFEKADIIVAKGQANYETLEGARPGIFFLLRAKCTMVSRDLGVPQGSWIVMRS